MADSSVQLATGNPESTSDCDKAWHWPKSTHSSSTPALGALAGWLAEKESGEKSDGTRMARPITLGLARDGGPSRRPARGPIRKTWKWKTRISYRPALPDQYTFV
ncbi:hypothetical protein [Bordetella hinzii]|uniref:hypothetical protein n=1 Tax=Bordetella hinzii TaxID=103855 RepID=UPI000A920D5D|nr:hypothetical protein [Bordetella hinzii]MCJ9709052.1 hypothetical protein [Bordetella hinzii]